MLHQTQFIRQFANLWLFVNWRLDRFALQQVNWSFTKLRFVYLLLKIADLHFVISSTFAVGWSKPLDTHYTGLEADKWRSWRSNVELPWHNVVI